MVAIPTMAYQDAKNTLDTTQDTIKKFCESNYGITLRNKDLIYENNFEKLLRR